MNLALDSLLTLFARHGLHPILQKGQGLASLYAYPLLRECGDIDLYFVDEKEFESASDSIQAQGIRLTAVLCTPGMVCLWNIISGWLTFTIRIIATQKQDLPGDSGTRYCRLLPA